MRKTNFNLILLNSIFMIGLVMSNLFGGKIITVLGFTVAGAIVTYPLTFLSTDIIGEIWGKQEANECVKIGIIVQLVFLALGYLSLAIPAAGSKQTTAGVITACPKSRTAYDTGIFRSVQRQPVPGCVPVPQDERKVQWGKEVA